MELIQANREIDKLFGRIEDICKEYLSMSYPDAPDSDLYMYRICDMIDSYWQLIDGGRQ